MNLDDLIKKRKKEYDLIDRVKCPILRCDVVFNTKGWRHLIHWENRKRRVRGDLLRRLALFPKVKEIISSKKSGIRVETDGRFTNTFLTKGKVTVMLQKKVDSDVIYYYSVWNN